MFSFIDHLSTPVVYLTQSLWRDEAFSYVLSKNSVFNIVIFTSQDFNPPLYYLLLHFWMKLIGNSEVSMRSLSFIFHILTCYVVYKLTKRVFDGKNGTLAFLLTFFNPMLLYFSFEARMYSLLALLAVSSMYFFYLKKWRLWFFVSCFGVYTHLFFWFTILSQITISFIIKDWKKYLLRFALLLLIFTPWVPFVLIQIFKGNQGFWVNKIDLQLVLSSLGNILTSYEGTPGGLWNFTAFVSFGLLILSFDILKKRRDLFTKLNIVWLYVPLFTIITISLWKPLFVNRYLIFLTIPMIFMMIIVIDIYKKIGKLIFLAILFFEISVFLYLGPYYRKVDIREVIRKINMQTKIGDVIVSKTPITYFETNYYSSFRSFLYAPDKNRIPTYVGKALINESKIVPDFSLFKYKVFLINDDGTVEVLKPPFM